MNSSSRKKRLKKKHKKAVKAGTVSDDGPAQDVKFVVDLTGDLEEEVIDLTDSPSHRPEEQSTPAATDATATMPRKPLTTRRRMLQLKKKRKGKGDVKDSELSAESAIRTLFEEQSTSDQQRG